MIYHSKYQSCVHPKHEPQAALSTVETVQMQPKCLFSLFALGIILTHPLPLLPQHRLNLFLAFVAGAEAVQGREAALQRRSRDAEGAAAPQYRAILRLLGVTAEREEVHRSGHGAHDLRDAENVGFTFNSGSLLTFKTWPLDTLLAFHFNHTEWCNYSKSSVREMESKPHSQSLFLHVVIVRYS